jgi:Holliday junction resolvasome RuvABC endonuclease subunit
MPDVRADGSGRVSAEPVVVLGLDLSLTSTGAAVAEDGHCKTWRVKPPAKLAGHERLAWLLERMHPGGHIDLVVIEGPAFGAKGSAYHQLAGLWWLVTHDFWSAALTPAIAPPASVKRYATGKGNAGKDDVLREVCRRFPDFGGGNDEADALTLAAMGADHLGHPIAAMPATHRAALVAVEWSATHPTPGAVVPVTEES